MRRASLICAVVKGASQGIGAVKDEFQFLARRSESSLIRLFSAANAGLDLGQCSQELEHGRLTDNNIRLAHLTAACNQTKLAKDRGDFTSAQKSQMRAVELGEQIGCLLKTKLILELNLGMLSIPQ